MFILTRNCLRIRIRGLRLSRRLLWGVGMAPAFLASLCVSALGLLAQLPPSPRATAPAGTETAASAVQQQPADPTVKNGLYVLQPGDEISIKAFRLPELDETVRIRPDGKISILLLDDIIAAGLTTQELSARVTLRYAQFFKEPKVSVIVRTFANQKVFVGGEVVQPGTIPIVGELTALGAVLQAGGFKNTAKTNSVILLRNNGHQVALAYKLNLQDVLTRGKANVVLKPFDVVYVPRSKVGRADKFVDQYIRQLIPISLTAGFTYIVGNRRLLVP